MYLDTAVSLHATANIQPCAPPRGKQTRTMHRHAGTQTSRLEKHTRTTRTGIKRRKKNRERNANNGDDMLCQNRANKETTLTMPRHPGVMTYFSGLLTGGAQYNEPETRLPRSFVGATRPTFLCAPAQVLEKKTILLYSTYMVQITGILMVAHLRSPIGQKHH